MKGDAYCHGTPKPYLERRLAAPDGAVAEGLGSPQIPREFARVGNEGLADLAARHPKHIAGFVACVPMNDVDSVLGYALDGERFEPISSRMAELDPRGACLGVRIP
jgi:hypothetical protein